MKRSLIIIIGILISICIAHAIIDPPMLPLFLHGKATVNGEDLKKDSMIFAKINDDIRGVFVIENEGLYGEAEGDNKLTVNGLKNEVGAEVSFFLKIPGFEEIRSGETTNWESGVMTELDLTFSGELIPEPEQAGSDQDSSSGSGSGSTGGSSSSGGTSGYDTGTTGQYDSFFYQKIEAGKQVDMKIKNKDNPFSKIQLLLNEDAQDVTITVRIAELSNIQNKIDNVYKYVSVETEGITDDIIDTAIISFRVENSWFEYYLADMVKLKHYDGTTWEILETVKDGSGYDNDNHYFRSSATGFSDFAIVSEPVKDSTKESLEAANQVVKGTDNEGNTESQSDSAIEDGEKESNLSDKVMGITGRVIGTGKGLISIASIIAISAVILGIFGVALFLRYSKIKGGRNE